MTPEARMVTGTTFSFCFKICQGKDGEHLNRKILQVSASEKLRRSKENKHKDTENIP